MKIEIVNEVTDKLVEAFLRLMPQLTPFSPAPDRKYLEQIIQSPCISLFVARDSGNKGAIVGALTLVVFPAPTGLHAWIEDVVVDDASRGQGVGASLVQEAIAKATRLGAGAVNLTSRPSREAANRLYQRLGFQQRQTNLYQLKLK
jgi:ribosomal protein S18 acetylase RimI-like enzyme